MEELSAKRTTNGVDGGSSISINSGRADNDKLEVVTDAGEETTACKVHFQRRIEKVPLLLRNNENNKGQYDPKVVSIGPYHHGRLELQFVENLKPMVARVFVSDSGKSIDKFYNKILWMVDEARSFYVEGSTDAHSDEKFAEMMLLDGCFILGMIESIYGQKPSRISKYDEVITHLGMLVWYSISADMVFLLENQIPFQVLESLMSLKFEDDEAMRMIDEFLHSPVSADLQFKIRKVVKNRKYEKPPLHLLELFRTKLLLDHICNSHRGTWKHKCRGKRILNFKEYIQSYRSVTELEAKGIHFSPSNSKSLNAVKFKSSCFYGRIELRPFFVTTKTKIMLSNMIAYELCPNNPNDLEVTSYIGFLKSLVDHADDVKELRMKHILFNTHLAVIKK
ncbi:hypothetical protein Acr_12g0007050 [Actinidia rufa]|uniref:Uncharacterized protein n=1 Tax=Actinidia rufa TaxID=165716 RepID=A0A7J0FHI6_9ERIC|nr:hypothetical protein Acr_12g0007050 [Actinidia rufa]